MEKCTQDYILELLRQIEEDSDDTVWLTAMETMFDRIVYNYEKDGGDMDEVRKKFPHYAL